MNSGRAQVVNNWIVLLLLAGALLLTAALGAYGRTDLVWDDVVAPVSATHNGRPDKQDSRLERMEWKILELVLAWQEGRLAEFGEQRAVAILPRETVRVIVETAPDQAAAALQQLRQLGGQVELHYAGLIQALVPVPALDQLGRRPEVRWVRLPYPVTTHQGSVVSEGVPIINADGWQGAGWDGQGMKVGIIDGGFAGYGALLGTELPSVVTTLWAPDEGTSVHGTGCAEIIYDIAPAAGFYLARLSTEVGLATAINWMVGHGVDVISFSMGYLNTAGPGDGTGWINDRVKEAHDAGVLFVNAAGNQAQRHWAGPWVDPEEVGRLEFAAGDYSNAFYAHAGHVVTVGLRWDDPWGASSNDYDLELWYHDGVDWLVVAGSWNWQTGTQDPTEDFQYVVPAGRTGWYHITVPMYDADGTSVFDLLTFRHDLQYQVPAGSITIPADSPHALTVGAVPWHDPSTLEPFSSQGPTTDGRTKPDLVAPDGVSTVSYGPSNFYGTSASAPHVAGAALLVKQSSQASTPAQLQQYLEAHAVDLGAPGKNNQFGSGRLLLPGPPTSLPDHFQVRRETGDVLTPGAYWGADFRAGSADLAEWVPVSEPVEPGDVLEIDPMGIGQYRLARGPCTVSVAGVVSTQPGFVLGSTFDVPGEGRALLALLGVVPVKVTDENGPIAIGDLLVVSSTPGHAMRWDPDSGQFCGLVGKALEPHEEGRGIIRVLLTR